MGKTEVNLIVIAFNAFFVLFIVAYIIFFRQYILKKKEYDNKLKLQEENYKKELLNMELEIQQQTMGHIGREIHDNIGQKLTLTSLNLHCLMLNKNEDEKKELQSINEIIGESLGLLRGLSKSLTDNRIVELNFYELIEEEIQKINKIKPFNIIFNYDDMHAFDYQQKVVLFRITQEFIQNSIKYAKCKNVHISLDINEKDIHYVLTDDGIGFNMKALENKGIGLANMKKRVELLQGKVKIKSELNKGTTVELNIPTSHEKNNSYS